MAGARKRGANRYQLSLQALTAGTSADNQDPWVYDAYAEGAATSSGVVFPYDVTAEQITEAYFATGSNFTGQATNFASFCLQQYRGSTTALNDIRVAFSSTNITLHLGDVANLNVASGGTVTGTGSGVLLVSTGSALPWSLQPGDVIVFSRISNNSTGDATPAMGLTFVTKQANA